MGYDVKVSLKQGLKSPMFCVVCGGTTSLHPRGYFVTGYTNKIYMNYRCSFFFPVCIQCVIKYRKIYEKRKWFRTSAEKAFLKKLYNQAVVCWLHYRPLLGIKWARFTFNRKDYAEAFAELNSEALK